MKRPAKYPTSDTKADRVQEVMHGAFASKSATAVIRSISKGLPLAELETLRDRLGVPENELATYLGIARATLHRRKREGHLTLDESDRIVRFARLVALAVEVLEDEGEALRWLKTPKVGLGGAIPLEFARTEVGAREIEHLLTRIEFGVYS